MMNTEKRLQTFRQRFLEAGADGALITDGANVYYLSGFLATGGDASLLILSDRRYILTDDRYTLQAREQCPEFTRLGTSATDFTAIKSLRDAAGLRKIGFEDRTVSYVVWRKMSEALPDVAWTGLGDMLEAQRNIKDPEEIERIAHSCAIACTALAETLPFIRPGVRETDVAAELEYRMRRGGAAKTSFDTIIASGARSALPHGAASDKVICRGDAVTMDFGAWCDGYCSDMTRTFFVGEAPDALRRIYATVLEAQLAAIDAFRPGMTGQELDAVARGVIEKAGYGREFGHGLGHGVGIEIHEGVRVSRTGTMRLTDGMVFSIEPGIYVDGLGGVRIEDLVACENGKLRILTAASEKQLAIL